MPVVSYDVFWVRLSLAALTVFLGLTITSLATYGSQSHTEVMIPTILEAASVFPGSRMASIAFSTAAVAVLFIGHLLSLFVIETRQPVSYIRDSFAFLISFSLLLTGAVTKSDLLILNSVFCAVFLLSVSIFIILYIHNRAAISSHPYEFPFYLTVFATLYVVLLLTFCILSFLNKTRAISLIHSILSYLIALLIIGACAFISTNLKEVKIDIEFEI